MRRLESPPDVMVYMPSRMPGRSSAMKKAPLILMTINGLLWGGLVWMGFDGERALKQARAQSY